MPTNPSHAFVSGGVGGICAIAVGYPFDTIKVRMQTQGAKQVYTGTFDCFKKIIAREGYTGLYRGISGPISSAAPIFALGFMGFSIGKRILAGDNGHLSMTQIAKAGMMAGISSSLIMAPVERVKCLIQTQQNNGIQKYRGTLDCALQMYKQGGLRNLYKGTVATLARGKTNLVHLLPAAYIKYYRYSRLWDIFFCL